jgi:hypothetical protein
MKGLGSLLERFTVVAAAGMSMVDGYGTPCLHHVRVASLNHHLPLGRLTAAATFAGSYTKKQLCVAAVRLPPSGGLLFHPPSSAASLDVCPA